MINFLDEDNSDLEKGFFVIYFSIFEIMLSQIEWEEGKTTDDFKKVLSSLVAGFERKMKYIFYFRGLINSNFYARSKILSKIDQKFIEQLPQKNENEVFFSGNMTDEQTIMLINEFSYRLIE